MIHTPFDPRVKRAQLAANRPPPGATLPAALSIAAHARSPGVFPSVAYDHSVLATPWDVIAVAVVATAASSAAHVSSEGPPGGVGVGVGVGVACPSLAYACMVFATPCGVMSGTVRAAAASRAIQASFPK